MALANTVGLACEIALWTAIMKVTNSFLKNGMYMPSVKFQRIEESMHWCNAAVLMADEPNPLLRGFMLIFFL